MAGMPIGTVTFLFTDVEGSTRLWEEHPAAMRAALVQHDALVELLAEQHHGCVVRHRGEGDSRFCVFAGASDAVAAAAAVQEALHEEPWPTPAPLRVRIGLHTGEADLRDGDYYGAAVNRCARLRSIAHGGQTLLSDLTADLVRGGLPPRLSLRNLGEHRLRDLLRRERVFELRDSARPTEHPPLRSLDATPNNLPAQATPFVGRARELSDVGARLARPDLRLLTLLGPGGVGKTRLALAVAAEAIGDHWDGVYFVALDQLLDPAMVAPTIARTLGLPESGGRAPAEALRAHLADQRALLLLDNFEQVLGAIGLVADLLAACPRLKVLATSRANLRVSGEFTYTVPPLGLPPEAVTSAAPPPFDTPVPALDVLGSDAVRLFLARAEAVRPDLAFGQSELAAVVTICRQLDGLPLAIELAAARVKLLTPSALLPRLERVLTVLTGGARDLPIRQQTLRGAIDWSYHLLIPAEQRLFRRLGVFAGGFTFEAAEAVCPDADALDGVASLVENSLVRPMEADGPPRFVMLAAVTEYALEQLAASGELPSVRRRHAELVLALAETARPHLFGRRHAEWLPALDREHDNARAALRWALDAGEAEVGLRLAAALQEYWLIRGVRDEARSWLRRCLDLGAPRDDLRASRAEGLAAAALFDQRVGEHARALSAIGEALELARAVGHEPLMDAAVRRKAEVLTDAGDQATARGLLEMLLTRERARGDVVGVAHTLNVLTLVLFRLQDFSAARVVAEEAVAAGQRAGSLFVVGHALHRLVSITIALGNLAQAAERLQASRAAFAEIGDPAGVGHAEHGLALLAANAGEHGCARAMLTRTLGTFRRIGEPNIVATLLHSLGGVAGASGDARRACRLEGAAGMVWRTATQSTRPLTKRGHYRSLIDPWIAGAAAELGEESAAAERATGAAMTVDEAVAYALADQD